MRATVILPRLQDGLEALRQWALGVQGEILAGDLAQRCDWCRANLHEYMLFNDERCACGINDGGAMLTLPAAWVDPSLLAAWDLGSKPEKAQWARICAYTFSVTFEEDWRYSTWALEGTPFEDSRNLVMVSGIGAGKVYITSKLEYVWEGPYRACPVVDGPRLMSTNLPRGLETQVEGPGPLWATQTTPVVIESSLAPDELLSRAEYRALREDLGKEV